MKIILFHIGDALVKAGGVGARALNHAVKAEKYPKGKGVKKFLANLSSHKDVLVGLGTGNPRAGAFIKLMKIKQHEVFVIGDTRCRVEAAKEAGYHSGAVSGCFGDPQLLMRSNPELMAKDFSNMKPWLIWLGLEKDPKGVSRGAYICPDSPIEHAHYGRTGMDLREIEIKMKQLREAKKKITGRKSR